MVKETAYIAHGSGAPVNGSQEPKDTAHTTPPTERAPSEQEPSGQGHRTCNTTHRAGTPVNRSGGAKDTARTAHRAGTPVDRGRVVEDIAHATQHTDRLHR